VMDAAAEIIDPDELEDQLVDLVVRLVAVKGFNAKGQHTADEGMRLLGASFHPGADPQTGEQNNPHRQRANNV